MNLAKGFAFLGRGVLRGVTSRSIHSAGSSVPPFRLGDTTFRHRPWRFWDMHIPPTAFGYEPRDSDKTRDSEYSSYNRVAGPTLPVPPGARTIPNTHLPGPWTCEWSNWRVRRRAEEITLDEFTQEIRHKYGIPGALNPIVFHNTHWDTQTVLESRGRFYLFDNDCDGRRHHRLYKFPGVYVSVEDFFDRCYWNEMEVVKRARKSNSLVPTIASPETLPLTHSDRGLRLASAEPYRKRYLLDMTMPKGPWKFEPRTGESWSWLGQPAHPNIALWPTIPDEQLPEPFSCAWDCYRPASTWYKLRHPSWSYGAQEELRLHWGVSDLTPVMFMALDTDRFDDIPCVLRRADTYYLWLYVETDVFPELRKFEGTYASVEDFVENADWNRMYKFELEGDFMDDDRDIKMSPKLGPNYM